MNPQSANQLVREKSPYLLQHANNPVNWLPWGQEAFAKARSENKPIFLSIGYSTCHWCHVMAHESFENEATAQLLNDHFVSIKVDREERPDVDRVYMMFIQATTGSGGWPMSVFLTPGLKPFAGGTYFPPEDRYGRAGFPTVLLRVSEAWNENQEQVLKQGDRMVEALRSNSVGREENGQMPGEFEVQAAMTELQHSFDAQYGGFGSAPKFPRPVTLNLLFRIDDASAPTAREMALSTLKKMAAGGMHDHLGGGFHRYSVDRYWHVPHFEKMLYDQAQLAISYLEAFQVTQDPFYAEVARDILEYVRRDMTDPEGGFYSAEDADSLSPDPAHPHQGEGLFYVWSKQEIEAALGAQEAEIFAQYYGIELHGNAPEGSDPQEEFIGKNILIQRHSVKDLATSLHRTPEEITSILAESRATLFAIRAKRPKPHLDDKIITAWNGLMISAFARAAQVLGEPSYLQSATRAAAFINHQLMLPDGTLLRSYRQGAGNVRGFADDYAFFIQALLDLYEAGFDIQWLKLAVVLQKELDNLFGDPLGGGYFGVMADDPDLFLRMKEEYDGAEPSPNSIAALNLLRLAQMTGEEAFAEFGRRTIGAFGEQLRRMPTAMPQMLVAFKFAMAKPRQIVIAADPGQAGELLRRIHSLFIPNKVLLLADGDESQERLGTRRPFLKTIAQIEGKPSAYVCENFSCQLPTNDPDKLGELLA
jgi:uncharacterized protein YyaL (SSP411 family)